MRGILADVFAELADSQRKCDKIARGEFADINEAHSLARTARVAAEAAAANLANLEMFLGYDQPEL